METIELTELIDSLPEKIKIKGELTNLVENRIEIDGEHLDSTYSKKIWNHSPCGFSWGYSGSGPAQLSLGLLLKYLPPDLSKKLYQDFKREVISKLPQENFEVEIELRYIVRKIITDKLLRNDNFV